MEYGYVRVSTREQNEGRQLLAMQAQNIPPAHVLTDKQSGRDFARPAWQALVAQLQPNDLLYIHSIDRLGRNYKEIQHWWRVLTKDKNVDIVVIDMPLLDTRRGRDLVGTFLADVVLQVLAFCAENERANIRQRQSEGIQSAHRRGVKFGRPAKPLPRNFGALVAQWEEGRLPLPKILAQLGISESTFYRRLRVYRSQ